MIKDMKEGISGGVQPQRIIVTNALITSLITEIKNTFSWTSGNNIATVLMGLLRGCSERGTLPIVSQLNQGEDRSPVVDIVNAGPRKRFAVYSSPSDSGVIAHNCLGLQYGMKSKSLSKKLTLDTGTEVSEREAKRLENIHKKNFRVFWNWIDVKMKQYKRDKHLTLWDGWTLLGDNDNDLSVKNFPVQGTAAVILRLAVQKATDYGVKIMCPLHDAIYARCYDNEADIEWTNNMMDKAMNDAVSEVLGDRLVIRIDTDIHKHDDVWIEGKGAANYKRLSKFLTHQDGSIESKREMRKAFTDAINLRCDG